VKSNLKDRLGRLETSGLASTPSRYEKAYDTFVGHLGNDLRQPIVRALAFGLPFPEWTDPRYVAIVGAEPAERSPEISGNALCYLAVQCSLQCALESGAKLFDHETERAHLLSAARQLRAKMESDSTATEAAAFWSRFMTLLNWYLSAEEIARRETCETH
jgi:hypothetical protein